MANETLARRYALAIFDLAQERGAVPVVGSDLRTIADGIFEDEATKGFFLSPVIDRKEKERILTMAFEGKTHEVALHALLLLVRKRREALLREIVKQYAELEMQARGVEALMVTSAKQLSPDQLQALVTRLEKIYDKKFEVTQRVDPQLIGGVRITIGDRRVDGSVEGRLEELTRTLFAKN
jgi:F-type H+-transporting ATPase subunit delta